MSGKEIGDHLIPRFHQWILGLFVLFYLDSPEFISPSKKGIWEVPALFPFMVVNQDKRLHLKNVGMRDGNQDHIGIDFVA